MRGIYGKGCRRIGAVGDILVDDGVVQEEGGGGDNLLKGEETGGGLCSTVKPAIGLNAREAMKV